MSAAAIGLPAELPEKPDGYTRRMALHLNFGRAGGAATYTCHDPQGKKCAFGYQYDTRKDGLTGFNLPNVEGVMTWAQLRAAWPEWIKTRGRAEGAPGDSP